LKNRNIIIVGQQPWDTEIGSNCKNIAVEFAKNNRVLYINPPLDRITKLRHGSTPAVKKRLAIIAGQKNGVERISNQLFTLYPDCLIESINWLPGQTLFNFFNQINNKRFFKSIKPYVDQLGFTDPVLFNDGDIFRSFYLIELLKPSVSIYYSRDNMIATAYYRKHGLDLEPKLIAKSNVCVANSEYLRDYCVTYNAKSFYVGQGCDFELFDNYLSENRPRKSYPFKSPIIGYVGALTAARLDIKLITDIAKLRPEWNIVLVGPEDDEFRASDLHQLSNVYFEGSKPTNELPEYIDSFDVCFNPQAINPLTIGNYPRKIDEYLVMGKPTIATATKSMEAFKEHVYLANTLAEYISGISKLLNDINPNIVDVRKSFARSHSWTKSVDEIYLTIET